jgi:hypothetical protein
MTSEMDRKLIAELSHRKVPIVFLDVGKATDRISNISIDYAQGIRQAISHLAQLGHKRIGFISGPSHLKSARIRRAAFLEHLHSIGAVVSANLVQEGDHKIAGGQRAMEELLALKNPPTAVLTSNDLSAYGALNAIHAHGLNVPEDVSVIGFDDIDFSQFTKPLPPSRFRSPTSATRLSAPCSVCSEVTLMARNIRSLLILWCVPQRDMPRGRSNVSYEEAPVPRPLHPHIAACRSGSVIQQSSAPRRLPGSLGHTGFSGVLGNRDQFGVGSAISDLALDRLGELAAGWQHFPGSSYLVNRKLLGA